MAIEDLLELITTFVAEDLQPLRKDLFELSSYEDVLQDVNSIQSQREITKTMINMRRIQPFLIGMEHLEKVLITIGFQHTTKVMTYVWGPVRFLLEISNLTEKEIDSVLDIYEQLGGKLLPLFQYVQFFTRIPENEMCLVHIYQDVFTFHQLAYRLFSVRPSLRQKLFKPTWRALGGTFTHLTDSLEGHGQFIQAHGSSFHNPLAILCQRDEPTTVDFGPCSAQDWETMRDKTYAYVSSVDKHRDKFIEDEKLRKDQMKGSILAWISASKKMQSFHKKNQDARICRDTGRWIFKRYREVNGWMKGDQSSESAIWLHGSRGFGKTILASLLIDELAELRTQKKSYAIPQESKIYYFYCQEEDSEHRTHLDILRGILHQMVDSNEDLLPLCVEKSESSGKTNLADTDVAQSLIEAFLEYNSSQYIIIDGLEECESSNEMLKTAAFFMKQVTKFDKEIKQGRLRLLFMSQMTPELVNARVMPEDESCIRLKSTDNADDIRSYVKKRIPEFSEKRAASSGFNLSESDKEQIESIVCHRSEEMFLYAYLVIEYLLQQPTKAMLLEKVKEELLPKKLSQIYEKLLGTVKSELQQLDDGEAHWKVAKNLLGWLICAKRPLKWHEMQSILSYDPAKQKVDFDNRMLRQNAEKYLGSLVHILDGDHIRIVHSTARRYIIQNEHINAQAVQCELAMICLRYLCLLSSSNDYNEAERREKVKLGWFSFQDYACSQWHSHISTVIKACEALFCDGNYSQSYIDDFGSALQLFIAKHHADLTAEPHPDVSNRNDHDLTKFSRFPFYENLCHLWNHIYTHQKGTFEVRNTVGIAQIDKALLENRKVLEMNFTPDSRAWLNDTIQDYYGPSLFKCKRTLCKLFYLGYDKKEDREAHNNRHDRPYQCPSPNCSFAPLGFSSKKDKDRHVQTYHRDLSANLSHFQMLRVRTGRTDFTCSLCGKKFTRKITLMGHERSHFGERPYKCSHCDKAFARSNDCQRHQKIHSRRGL